MVPHVPLPQVYYNPFASSSTSVHKLLMVARSRHREEEDGALPRSGRARQLRASESDAVVRRYLDVRNMRQVARKFRMSRTTVSKVLIERGIETSRSMEPSEGCVPLVLMAHRLGLVKPSENPTG